MGRFSDIKSSLKKVKKRAGDLKRKGSRAINKYEQESTDRALKRENDRIKKLEKQEIVLDAKLDLQKVEDRIQAKKDKIQAKKRRARAKRIEERKKTLEQLENDLTRLNTMFDATEIPKPPKI